MFTPKLAGNRKPETRCSNFRVSRFTFGSFMFQSLAMAMGFLLCQSASAALLRTEQFVGYGSGNLGADSTTGTINSWNLSTAEVTLTNGSASLDGTSLGLVASAGGRAFISAYTNATLAGARNQFVPNSTFPQGNDTNIYYSFLYKFRNAADVSADGELLFRVNRANSGINTAQHWDLVAKNVAGQIQLGISKAGAPNNATNYAAVNISAGQTFFVVVRQHIIPAAQNDVYDLWINPPAQFFGTNEVDVPPSDASIGALTTDGTEDASGTGPGRFVVLAGANAEFDEFRAATTWAEATPWFGQCVPASVNFTSVTNITNSAELSATFRVAALGTSPTIQWQRSTNSGSSWDDISGATVATYTTPNLALNESGSQYRAIVNVACDGSSRTSGVATVTLTAPTISPLGVVMNDTFLDPDLGFDDRSNLPLTSSNSVWFTGASPQSLVAFEQGGNMVGTTVAGASSLWLGYFRYTNDLPVHLDVGRAIKVTLPFTPGGTLTNLSGAPLRFGVFDYADGGTKVTVDGATAGGSAGNGTGVRGYMLNLSFVNTNSDETPMEILARTSLDDLNLIGTTGDYTTLDSGPANTPTNVVAFQSGSTYTLEFTVARIGVNTVTVTTTITGLPTTWSFSVTDSTYAYHRFDAFAIRPNSQETTATTFIFQEFKVEVIAAAVQVNPFNITDVSVLSPGAVKLTWDSVNGTTYNVLTRDSLTTGSWTTNATVQATDVSTSYTNSPIAGSVTERYYRIQAQ